MAIYSFSHEVTPGANAACSQLIAASTNSVFVYKVAWGTAASPTSAGNINLGRPATKGTASTTAAWLAEDQNAPTGTALVASAWSTGPTVPAHFFRITRPFHAARWTLDFPRGLVIAVSSSLVLWNNTTHTGAVTEITWAGAE